MPQITSVDDLAQRSKAASTDPEFWNDVADLYDLDPSFLQLNFGYYHPAMEAVNRVEAEAVRSVNRQGSYFKATRTEDQIEQARNRLGLAAGVSPEEVALVRSSSEAINMVIQGWPLGPGDEVVASTVDYTAVQEVLAQRELHSGIVVRRVEVPGDPEMAVEASDYLNLFTDRTKLVIVTDLVHLTGRRMPSLEVIRAAHQRGVPVFIDAAHSFGQLDTMELAQEADFFCASLHKWVGAPLGTGMLIVRPGALEQLMPLYGDVSHRKSDIRRLERLGDRSDAVVAGLIEALKWHSALGVRQKGERLRSLHDCWARILESRPEFTFLSPAKGARSAIGAFRVGGISADDLRRRLWEDEKIHTTSVSTPWGQVLRVVPGLATTEAQLERFAEAVLTIRRTLSR